jgi:dihydrofolate reductase
MAKIIASEFVTLDGYMVGENEDMSWVIDNFNEDMGKEMRGHLRAIGGVILGRVTYEIMVPY